MSGINVRYGDQPITCAVSAAVVGGQPLDADQSNSSANGALTVKPSVAGSKLCVGVALMDAAPAGTDPSDYAVPRFPNVTVARAGSVVPVTFSGASVFGDRVKTDGNGGVTPWIDGTDDPAEIIGINYTETGSVAAAAQGLISLLVG